MAQSSIATEVDELIVLLLKDPQLNHRIKSEARGLRSLTVRDPATALTRLEDIYDRWVDTLPRYPPSVELCRAVPVDAYWRYHVSSDVRSFFPTSNAYRSFVLGQPDPETTLRQHLNLDDPLIPARNSWLAPCKAIAGMSGRELKGFLGLRTNPPYVVFHLSPQRASAHGVEIRPTSALDAIPSRFTEWTPGGLPSGDAEYIDRDIPVASLQQVELRP